MTTNHQADLWVRALDYAVGGKPPHQILSNIDLTVPSGKIVGIVGPNGSGKTTLLRIIIGTLSRYQGEVFIGETHPSNATSTRELSGMERARMLAMVEQDSHPHDDLTAREVIALGLLPHQGRFSGINPWADQVDHAAHRVGVTELLDRAFLSLSGGERQRVHLARALAQTPRLLLLDEPTNHLDIGAQLHLLDLIRRVAADGAGVVVSLHDLSLAARVSDEVVVLHEGRIAGVGPPLTTLSPPMIRDVWNVDAQWVEALGKPTLVIG